MVGKHDGCGGSKLLIGTVGVLVVAWQGVAVAEVDGFRPYADQLVDRLVVGTEQLSAAVEAGDLDEAKRLWIAARYGWERGETFFGEFFPEHDEAIDFWPDAEQGFHAIEPLLFVAGDVEAAAPLMRELEAAVDDLAVAFADTSLTRQGLLNGTAGLVFEIGSEKAEGGESPYSDTSLTDMQNNMVGIEAAYALAFAGDLEAADRAMHQEVTTLLIALTEALDVAGMADLDQPDLLRLSEALAIALQDAAGPLGLETPKLGG